MKGDEDVLGIFHLERRSFCIAPYKCMDGLINEISKSFSRMGAKWFYTLLSETLPETWLLKTDGLISWRFCKLSFCGNWNRIDMVKHMLVDCNELNNLRKRFKIKGEID